MLISGSTSGSGSGLSASACTVWIILNPSSLSSWLLYNGIYGYRSSKLIENPNFCYCCLTVFLVFLLFPFFATSIAIKAQINHSLLKLNLNLTMKASSSKSQLVTYRNKAVQNDKPTLTTNRRKSQQSQSSKENKAKVNLIKE